MYLSSANTVNENQKTMEEAPRFSKLLRLAPQFDLLHPESSARANAEKVVSAGFERAFAAKLESFMPALLSMHCVGKLSGVAGVCLAGNQPLFLEQYLDAPIESVLQKQSIQAINRESIVEVGNLVAANNGASLAVFIVLASSLERAGFSHMVFTTTNCLTKKFSRLGFETSFLADASIDKLKPSQQSNWGTYYLTNPRVVAGDLTAANELINQRPLYSCIKTAFEGQIEAITELLLSSRTAL